MWPWRRIGRADVDQEELGGERQQEGTLRCDWKQVDEQTWELLFDYRAERSYQRDGEQRHASAQRGLMLRIENASSPPSYKDRCIEFPIELEPQASWHACMNLIPSSNGTKLPLRYRCHSLLPIDNEFDQRQQRFLGRTTGFETPGSGTLAPVVHDALERSKRDLSGLRLYDLDQNESD